MRSVAAIAATAVAATAAIAATAVARRRGRRGAGDRRRRGDRVGRVRIGGLDPARRWGERALGLRSERGAPRGAVGTEAAVVEVRGVGSLEPAPHAGALGRASAPPLVGLLPRREVALHLGEVEEAARLLRSDAPVLPEQPGGRIDIERDPAGFLL